MKKFNKYVIAGLAAATMASCADLDTEYLGQYVTPEQKGEVLEQNPEMASASANGIPAYYFGIFRFWSGHIDFGYPAVMLGMDSMGQDLVGKQSGYNWMNAYEGYTDLVGNGYPSAQLWYYNYAQINMCNSQLLSLPAETDQPLLQFYRAQALANRANLYWTLAQMYQHNYDGYQNEPCVPLITEENMDVAAAEGCGRATVEEVFTQIMYDLDEAIGLIAKSGLQPSDVMSVKPKRFLSLAATYGLRARVNLTMHHYADAAADAQQAINNFDGRPYSLAEVGVPSFTNINDPAWMWGIAINETDYGIAGGSIVNLPSMSCTFSYGYVVYGAWRWCNKKLYDSIPASDKRKTWFLDENRQCASLTPAQQAYIDQYNIADAVYTSDSSPNIMPYTNVKFNSYKGVLGQGLNAADIPMMRIEEMYLTLFEGQAMSGQASTAREGLVNFIKTYRDPEYAFASNDAAALQEEIWHQRRIELWGEGLSYFDLQRLHKDIDRVGCAFPNNYTYQIPYGDPNRLLLMPQEEITANKKLTGADQNPSHYSLTPVKGL